MITGVAFLLSGSLPSAEAQTTTRILCIDPGHSKATVGTQGRRLTEYKICWQMALLLQQEMEARGARAILTKRTMEENVSNAARAEVANRAHATLLIRLHCDAGEDNGIATHYPDRQGTKKGVRGPSRAVIAASRRAAQAFHTQLIRSLTGALRDRGLRTDMQTKIGKELGGALEGSIHAQVPVLLVEMAVLKSAKDEAFLASERGRRRLAKAMADGIDAATTGPRSSEDGNPLPGD